ncbi:hypothetical protein [Paraburkholderia unamae]|uniref:Uncharacterized protein n=1 Tax=Paraburkholderia unamae TaxID=219649 RepID=A0ACC6RGQ6_9BURK
MSIYAHDLLDLITIWHADDGQCGSLTFVLMQQLALNIIAPGCADFRGGC